MEEGRLAYRVRTATPEDDAALRTAIGTTLAHPDHQGKRESFRGAATKGELLILEHFDRQDKEWHAAGFVEHHMRVDDMLTIRDVGTAGDEPHGAVVRYLLDDVLGSFKPKGASVKVRRDARSWIEIFESIPGFVLEGEEYRRPNYWTVWSWDPARVRPVRPPRPTSSTGQQRPLADGRPPARENWSPQRPSSGPGARRFPPGPNQDPRGPRGRP